MSAKMQAIADTIKLDTPYSRIECDDHICSSVCITGSFDAKDTWTNHIFENSRHFRFMIRPIKNARYFECEVGKELETKVEVELIQGWKVGKFRKYTGPASKVVAKVLTWIEENKAALTEV